MSLKSLQEKIGVGADGAFGPGTMKKAMEAYQQRLFENPEFAGAEPTQEQFTTYIEQPTVTQTHLVSGLLRQIVLLEKIMILRQTTMLKVTILARSYNDIEACRG